LDRVAEVVSRRRELAQVEVCEAWLVARARGGEASASRAAGVVEANERRRMKFIVTS
jgi:hypothetical protein